MSIDHKTLPIFRLSYDKKPILYSIILLTLITITMALAESIKQKVDNTQFIILSESSTQDFMLIGGYASNLLTTDAYLTVKPFLSNAKIERGFPFQFSSKVLIPQNEILKVISSDTPINLFWDSSEEGEWTLGSEDDWISPSPGKSSVLLNLTIAGI